MVQEREEGEERGRGGDSSASGRGKRRTPTRVKRGKKKGNRSFRREQGFFFCFGRGRDRVVPSTLTECGTDDGAVSIIPPFHHLSFSHHP